MKIKVKGKYRVRILKNDNEAHNPDGSKKFLIQNEIITLNIIGFDTRRGKLMLIYDIKGDNYNIIPAENVQLLNSKFISVEAVSSVINSRNSSYIRSWQND